MNKITKSRPSFPNSEAAINEICAKYRITNYTVNSDFSINVTGSINLSGQNLSFLPIKFKEVTGDFTVSDNILESMEGFPSKITGNFDASINLISSLENSPTEVSGTYTINKNMLNISVDDVKAISQVKGYITVDEFAKTEDSIRFFCSNNNITNYVINSDLSITVTQDVTIRWLSLTNRYLGNSYYYYADQGLPVKFRRVTGNFTCNSASLSFRYTSSSGREWTYQQSLFTPRNMPQIVDGDFVVNGVGLISLQNTPYAVNGNYLVNNNNIRSLEGVPAYLNKDFNAGFNTLKNLNFSPVSVGKDFIVKGCQALEAFDSNLIEVLGNFDASDCPNLESINKSPDNIAGYFNISGSGVKSLQGGPVLVGSYYNATNTKLSNLMGAPHTINGDFTCNKTNTQIGSLVSLNGGPRVVKGNFDCSGNEITSLIGAPMEVKGNFNASRNELMSIDGMPASVEGDIDLSVNFLARIGQYIPIGLVLKGDLLLNNNILMSLGGCPASIGKNFNCSSNQLRTLTGSPTTVNGNYNCSNNPGKFSITAVKNICNVKGTVSADIATRDGSENEEDEFFQRWEILLDKHLRNINIEE